MTIVAYARVSTKDQDLSVQLEQLTAAGATKIFQEKASGRTASRDELQRMLDWVREDDVLLVTRLDRIARSVSDLHRIVKLLADKGVGFRCLQQPMDTTTPEGRLMMTILAGFAEFEVDLKEARQAEGIAAAKAKGVYTGKAPSVDKRIAERRQQILELQAQGLGATEIGRRLGVNKTTIYRTVPTGWAPASQAALGESAVRH